MIEIRQMFQHEKEQFLKFARQQTQKILKIEPEDEVILFLASKSIKGYAMMRQIFQDTVMLTSVYASQHQHDIREGLLRTVFHSMSCRGIKWIVVDEDLVDQLPFVRDQFICLEEFSDERNEWLTRYLGENKNTSPNHYYLAETDLVYQYHCRGVLVNDGW